jgi:hypothetical protein
MKQIPLSQGKFAIVDDEDFERVIQFKWSYIGGYAKRAVVRNDGKRRLYPLHRFIMGLSPEDDLMVDHVNFDKLDNRKENLRVCTKGQNNYNHGPKDRLGKSTSKYKGVSYKPDLRYKWRARIGIDGVEHILGYFPTEEDAALAYNKAAVKFFGEFAWLNDVE